MRKLKIAFVYSKRYSFYPPDYLGRGLGGTESTFVLLVKALAKLGHSVEVYNCCFKPGIYDGVTWSPLYDLDVAKEYDVFISLRFLETFQGKFPKAAIRGVWIHDEALAGATDFDKKGIINTWISVSETQKASILRNEEIAEKNWFVTRNAYDEDLYTSSLKKIPKIRNQAIYCSAPDRGLKYLLKMWQRIKSEVPDASLVVTGSFALWGTSDEENNRMFGDTYLSASSLKDVKIMQRVSKEELSKLQAESEVMLYPTDFNEMFCISALECFAAGTPIISSARAAMNERVKTGENGYLISGSPFSEEYQKEFISTAIRFFRDEDQKKQFSKNAFDASSGQDFESVAKEWEAEFIKRLQ